MGSWLHDRWKEQQTAVEKLGINVGDFIQAGSWSYWRKVRVDYGEHACNAYCRDGRWEYTSYHDIEKIHRKDDPWDHKEVMGMADETGFYDQWNGPAIPDCYRYQGNYSVKIWSYKWAGYLTTPKVEVAPLEAFAEKAGVPITGIPWNEFQKVQEALQKVCMRRWRIVVEPVPETVYGLSIKVRDHIVFKGSDD